MTNPETSQKPERLFFQKTQRLLKAVDFDRVFQRRKSQADAKMVMYGCESDRKQARLGLVVSRKCGNAVVRNKWKRRLREAFRQVQHELPRGIDLVIIPRPQTPPQVADLKRSMARLARHVASNLRQRDERRRRDGEPPA